MIHCDSFSPSYNLSLLSLLSLLLHIVINTEMILLFLVGLMSSGNIHSVTNTCPRPDLWRNSTNLQNHGTDERRAHFPGYYCSYRQRLDHFWHSSLEATSPKERERERVNPSPYWHIFNRPWQQLKDDYDRVQFLYSKCCCLMKPEERSLFLLSILHRYR